MIRSSSVLSRWNYLFCDDFKIDLEVFIFVVNIEMTEHLNRFNKKKSRNRQNTKDRIVDFCIQRRKHFMIFSNQVRKILKDFWNNILFSILIQQKTSKIIWKLIIESNFKFEFVDLIRFASRKFRFESNSNFQFNFKVWFDQISSSILKFAFDLKITSYTNYNIEFF